MESLWSRCGELPRFESLQQDLKTDVLVIGGGIAGILCAYMLQKAGVECALVEAERICSGVTQNTTAKITSQHGLIYDRLIWEKGLDAARLYLQAHQEALEWYRTLSCGIDCDFQEQANVVYSVNDRKKIERELEALHKIGFGAEYAVQLSLPFAVAGAVRFPGQAQFHPLKFLSALAKDLQIYENTPVLELRDGKAVTKEGKITAEKIIVATHFPFLNKHGSFFLKLYQHRSYVLALEGTVGVKEMYVDEDEKGLSFRQSGELLLLGGGSHRTGKKGGGWRELRAFAAEHFPSCKEAFFWATQDCMTLDGLPYIGQYSKRTPQLYVATGFNKWGMTSAMATASIIVDAVLGKENPYTELFSPSRSMIHRQLAVNAAESVLHLIKPTVPRCTHMGCALSYNKQEHTWDCPCHGSRYTKEGELIDNPAKKDLKNP